MKLETKEEILQLTPQKYKDCLGDNNEQLYTNKLDNPEDIPGNIQLTNTESCEIENLN